MELREIVIALAGMSIGLGIGLMVYVLHRLRETRNERWLAKSNKRYQKLMVKIDREQNSMQARVDELTALKEEYENVA